MTRDMTIDDEEYRFLYDSLQRKVKIIKEAPVDKDFFLSLAGFYKFIVRNEKLGFVIEMFGREYEKDHEEINKLASDILSETTDAFKEILSTIKEKKIVDLSDLRLIEDYYSGKIETCTAEQAQKINANPDKIIDAIRAYLSWANGKTQSLSGEPFEISMMKAVEHIVMILYESGHKDIAKNYVETANLDGVERINDFNISNSAKKYEELKNIVNNRDSTSTWKAFQNVQLVNICINDYEEERARLRKDDNSAALMNFNGLVDEMSQILKGTSQLARSPYIFKRNDYMVYLDRLYDKILDVLGSLKLLSKTGKKVEDSNEKKVGIIEKFIESTMVGDLQTMPKSGEFLAKNGDWIIRKPSVGKQFEIYYKDKPALIVNKSAWLNVFTKYIAVTRLSEKEICTFWNMAGGAWRRKGKAVTSNHIPVIHREIKDGLKNLSVVIDFVRQKGTLKGTYIFTSEPSSK